MRTFLNLGLEFQTFTLDPGIRCRINRCRVNLTSFSEQIELSLLSFFYVLHYILVPSSQALNYRWQTGLEMGWKNHGDKENLILYLLSPLQCIVCSFQVFELLNSQDPTELWLLLDLCQGSTVVWGWLLHLGGLKVWFFFTSSQKKLGSTMRTVTFGTVSLQSLSVAHMRCLGRCHPINIVLLKNRLNLAVSQWVLGAVTV